MKEEELKKHTICSRCQKKIGHTGIPMFVIVKVERFFIKSASEIESDGEMTEKFDGMELTLCPDCHSMFVSPALYI